MWGVPPPPSQKVEGQLPHLVPSYEVYVRIKGVDEVERPLEGG